MEGSQLNFVPSIAVLSGPPLHGKSTVANAIVARSNLIMLDVDIVKARLFPDNDESSLTTEQRLTRTARAYEQMVSDAEGFVFKGAPAILAATFSKTAFKRPLRECLDRLGETIPVRIFTLTVNSIAVIRARIIERQKKGHLSSILSEDKYKWALTLVDPWFNGALPTVIDASKPLEEVVQEVLSHMVDLKVSVAQGG